MVIGDAMTFLHWNNWCIGSQGPWGPGYGLISAAVCQLWAGKATARGISPTAVTRDVTSYVSYRISGRWHMRSCVTAYVIFRRYKSGCTPIPGSLFVSPVAGDLNTLLASRVTVSFPRARPGTSAVSKLKSLGFSCLFCYCNTDR